MSKPRITDLATWYQPARWSEDDLAMAVATRLRQLERELPFTFAHDQNAGHRSRTNGSRAKAMGMRAGEADIRIYAPQGFVGHIELKTVRGRLSAAQRQRHGELRALGHDVRVVHAATPGYAADEVEKIAREWLATD